MIDPAVLAAVAVIDLIKKRRNKKKVIEYKRPRSRSKKRVRTRLSVLAIYNQLGPIYFRRAYRMKYPSFLKLVGLVSTVLPERNCAMALVNGSISISVHLAVALPYFAGGSPYDITTTFGISFSEVFVSVWSIVDAINRCTNFDIEYPMTEEKQREIANGFHAVSGAGIKCCAGAIDGMLVWIHKPSRQCCTETSCADGKFLCGRKNKFGLNLQAVADVRGRFLDMSIMYPGSTSDCLAFEGMELYNRLERGGLHSDLCLFGDNAYVNSSYMATPFIGSNQAQDTYNFFHSQLRIRIECAFGMLTERWSLLRRIMPRQITVKKTTALVMCLAKLHNFCIDESDNQDIMYAPDEAYIELFGAVPLESTPNAGRQTIPLQLLGGGDHFDDVTRSNRRRPTRAGINCANEMLPRQRMLNEISTLGVSRPTANLT